MLTYSEFDTTAQGLLVDLRNAILASTDWTRLTSNTVILTTTAAASAGATTLTFASGDPATAGVVVGSQIAIEAPGSAVREYRTVTAVAATTVTVAALSFAHASGTGVYWGNELFKATTTRGADMIFDLNDTTYPTLFNLNMAVWGGHDGTTGTNRSPRYLSWRANATGAALSNPLHCIVSAGKEHIFISIEGPRAGEVGAVSAQYGSYRSYFFMSDMVPYHPEDTVPVAYAGGSLIAGINSAVTNNSYLGHLTENLAGTSPWDPTKLASVDVLGWNVAPTVGVNRQSAADGQFYLFPYLCVSNAEGLRGRLSSFFFAGWSVANPHDLIGVPPLGAKIVHNGQTYKLLAVDKGGASANSWYQFGANDNTAAGSFNNSVVVAVPCTP